MRRALLAAGFVVALLFLGALVFLRCSGDVQCSLFGTDTENFAACVHDGNPVMESFPRQCRDKAGVLFSENDSALYLHRSLPISFSYPGTLLRQKGEWPVIDILSGERGSVEVVASKAATPDEVLVSAFSVSGSTLTVVRGMLDPGYPVVTAFPSGASETGSGYIVLQMPPDRTDFPYVLLRGPAFLLQPIMDSLAFLPRSQ